MPDRFESRILRLIENLLEERGALPGYVRYMRLAIKGGSSGETGSKRSQLIGLPALCCQAVGGQMRGVDYITAAWLCFYQAAHLMDSLQDQDPPDAWWEDKGPPLALNIASGLYFTASLLLQQLNFLPLIENAAVDIIPDFYHSFLTMNNGQYLELSCQDLTLEQYWHNARAKSGAFFSLACWSGARLGTGNPTRLDYFRTLGENLGVLIQIKDDLEEIQPPGGSGVAGQRPKLGESLPVVYALGVLPPADKLQLSRALENAPSRPESAAEAIRLIDKSGASTYVLLELERHRQRALDALRDIAPEPDTYEQLSLLIRSL